ncbi:MAG: DUF47 family protein [Desulfovibrionaceae bacterium]
MFPSLLPKSAPFFELLLEQNTKLRDVSAQLVYLLEIAADKDRAHKTVAELEEQADALFQRITRHLSQTFITPIDREDILRINQAQEEAIDFIRNLTTRLHIYDFERVRFPALKLARTQHEMVLLTHTMLQGLSHKKDSHNTHQFRDLRSDCEMLLSVGIAELQDVTELTPTSIIDMIKWTQAYDRMELAVDQVVKLAETIEEAVLKNV